MNIRFSGRLSILALLTWLMHAIAGCATKHPTTIEREAVDVPAQFLVPTESGLVAPDKQGSSPGALVDPRNGNRLRLIRSVQGVGDYSVPSGAYSLRQDELLRVDSFGKPIGVVRR